MKTILPIIIIVVIIAWIIIRRSIVTIKNIAPEVKQIQCYTQTFDNFGIHATRKCCADGKGGQTCDKWIVNAVNPVYPGGPYASSRQVNYYLTSAPKPPIVVGLKNLAS